MNGLSVESACNDKDLKTPFKHDGILNVKNKLDVRRKLTGLNI